MRYAKKLRQTCPRWSSWKTSMNSTSCKSAQMLMLRSLKQDASIPTSSWQNYGYFLHFLTISVSLYASCFITCSVKFIDSIALIITLYTPLTHPPHQGMKGGVLGDLGLYGWVSNLLQDSMFGGSQSAAGMTCEGYWKQLTIAFKYLLISTLALAVVGLFTPNLVYLLANVMQQTVNHIQIWRLVTSFLANISLISLLFDLLIMSSFLPDLERRYSTAYMLAEIIIQNLYCNVVFVLLGEALSLVGLINSTGLATYGLTNVMLIFLWQRVSLNPQEMTRLWCLPCIMPMAYLPWCFMAILLIQGCLLGYYQHMILKRSLFVLPIRLYNSIQSCLPLKMKKQQGFISVSAAEGNIQTNSLASSYSRANAPPDSNELMSEVVSSGGVPIGGSQTQSSGNYRQHWLEQEEPQQQTGDDTTRALYPQVQPQESSHAINGIPRHNQTNNELL